MVLHAAGFRNVSVTLGQNDILLGKGGSNIKILNSVA